jgi:spermidine/putrescine transport system permease protein
MTALRRWFLAPSVLFLSVFFAAPFGIILLYSFLLRGVYGGVTGEWTFENYARLWDMLYGAILLRTIAIAGLATLGCLVLGFPLALFISRSGKRKALYLQLVMLPFWTSFLVRTYAWMFLLRDTGLINSALLATGLIAEPLPLLYNEGAVLIGLIYGYLPFVVLPLYANMERLDPALFEAAADLGARPWQAFLRVLVPLCLPGIWAGAILVYIPCLGAFLTPDLLGGGKSVMAGNVIQNQFTTARDWPFGSALSLVLTALVMVLTWVWMRRGGDEVL